MLATSELPLRSVSQLFTNTVAFSLGMKPQLPPQLPGVPMMVRTCDRLAPFSLRNMAFNAYEYWNSLRVPAAKYVERTTLLSGITSCVTHSGSPDVVVDVTPLMMAWMSAGCMCLAASKRKPSTPSATSLFR